jgi:spore coat protein U-like protein
MNTASKLTFAALALSVLGTVAAQAQVNNASITATATVQQPINVTGAQSLNFGNVFPGVAKTIAATDGTNAGRWDVTGQASSLVNLSFTLPANLTSGVNLLPIANFTGGTNTVNNAATAASITPSAGGSATLSGTGQLFVWVGAQVNAATNQPAGVYTASVTLTVTY